MKQTQIDKQVRELTQDKLPASLHAIRNREEIFSLSQSGVKDDSISKLFSEQKQRQMQFNSMHRLSSNIVVSQNMDGASPNVSLTNQQFSKTSQQDKTLKSPSFPNQPQPQPQSMVTSTNNFFKAQPSNRSYEDGYNKGIAENLLNKLSDGFNDLEKCLAPAQIAELKLSAGSKAMQLSYSIIQMLRLMNTIVQILLVYFGQFFNDHKKIEWEEFWVLHCLTFCIQFVFIVAGLLINIYWRYEETTGSKKNKSRFLEIIRTNRSDLVFCVFFLVEYGILIEFLLKLSTDQDYMLLFINFGIRINSISSAYASVLKQRRYLFLIFSICLLYLPLRDNLWRNNLLSVIQMIFSVITLMAIIFTVRFRFQEKVETAYKKIIVVYKNIVSDLSLRLQSASGASAENVFIAGEINALNKQLHEENQTAGTFLKQKSFKEVEGKGGELVRENISQNQQISPLLREKRQKYLKNSKEDDGSYQIVQNFGNNQLHMEEKTILAWAKSMCEGFCLIDEQLNVLGANSQLCTLLQCDSYESCVKMLMFTREAYDCTENSHRQYTQDEQRQPCLQQLEQEQQKEEEIHLYKLKFQEDFEEEESLEDCGDGDGNAENNFGKVQGTLTADKKDIKRSKYHGSSSESTAFLKSNLDPPVQFHQSSSHIMGHSKFLSEYENQNQDSKNIHLEQPQLKDKRISVSIRNSSLSHYTLPSVFLKNPLATSRKTIPLETFQNENIPNMEVQNGLNQLIQNNHLATPSVILKEIMRISAFVSYQEFSEDSIVKHGKRKYLFAKYFSESSGHFVDLKISILPLIVQSKLVFLIDVSDATVLMMECQKSLHSLIIQGVAEDVSLPLHNIISNIIEARSYSKPEFAQRFLNPMLVQANYAQNYVQVLHEITPQNLQNDFELAFSSQSIRDFLLEDISGNFFDDAKNRGVELLIQVDNSAPSEICSDFSKIKFILITFLEQFLLHAKSGYSIIIEARNSRKLRRQVGETINNGKKDKPAPSKIIEFSIFISKQFREQNIAEGRRLSNIFFSVMRQFESNSRIKNDVNLRQNRGKINMNNQNSMNQKKSQKSKMSQRLGCLEIAFLIADKLKPNIFSNSKTAFKENSSSSIDVNVMENGFPCVSFSVEDIRQSVTNNNKQTTQKKKNYDNSNEPNDFGDSSQVSIKIIEEPTQKNWSSTEITQRELLNNHEETQNDAQMHIKKEPKSNSNKFFFCGESFSQGDYEEEEVKETENLNQFQPRSINLHNLPIPRTMNYLDSQPFLHEIQDVPRNKEEQADDEECQTVNKFKEKVATMHYIEEENTSSYQRSSSTSQIRKPKQDRSSNLSFGTAQDDEGEEKIVKISSPNETIGLEQVKKSITHNFKNKQILFASPQILYHQQFQQALNQLSQDGEIFPFDSAFSVLEFLELIKQQFCQNDRFQYSFIFLDESLLSSWDFLGEDVLMFFQQNKVAFESSMFLLASTKRSSEIKNSFEHAQLFSGILPKMISCNDLLCLNVKQ